MMAGVRLVDAARALSQLRRHEEAVATIQAGLAATRAATLPSSDQASSSERWVMGE